MNKEKYNRIIDEVYKSYADSHFIPPKNPNGKLLSDQLGLVIPMEHSKETFINECRNNPKFSKKWGLKIEERELIRDERIDLYCEEFTDGIRRKYEPPFDNFIDAKLKTYNIPTKKITVTYKDEIIEFYE